jgi:hypothetical protein
MVSEQLISKFKRVSKSASDNSQMVIVALETGLKRLEDVLN